MTDEELREQYFETGNPELLSVGFSRDPYNIPRWVIDELFRRGMKQDRERGAGNTKANMSIKLDHVVRFFVQAEIEAEGEGNLPNDYRPPSLSSAIRSALEKFGEDDTEDNMRRVRNAFNRERKEGKSDLSLPQEYPLKLRGYYNTRRIYRIVQSESARAHGLPDISDPIRFYAVSSATPKLPREDDTSYLDRMLKSLVHRTPDGHDQEGEGRNSQ